jgi:hypothetical protein
MTNETSTVICSANWTAAGCSSLSGRDGARTEATADRASSSRFSEASDRTARTTTDQAANAAEAGPSSIAAAVRSQVMDLMVSAQPEGRRHRLEAW